jgi:hypothetical protein
MSASGAQTPVEERSGKEMTVNQSRRARQRRKAFDAAFDAYLEWRTRCDGVRRTYTRWGRSRHDAAASAFSAYERALNREESAAEAYAATIARVAALAQPERSRRLSDARPDAARR